MGIHEVLVKLQENRVKLCMICRKPCLDNGKEEKLPSKVDTIKSHMYSKLCEILGSSSDCRVHGRDFDESVTCTIHP